MDDEKSCYVGSFNENVTEDLLEELFTQVGPVTKVIIRPINNSNSRFALIEFEDEESVLFAIETLNGIKLFDIPLTVKPRNRTNQEELWRKNRVEIEKRQNSNPIPKRREHSYNQSSSNSPYHRPPPLLQQDYSRNSNYRNNQYSTPQNQRNYNYQDNQRQLSAPTYRQEYTPRRQGGDYPRRDYDRNYDNRDHDRSRREYDSNFSNRKRH